MQREREELEAREPRQEHGKNGHYWEDSKENGRRRGRTGSTAKSTGRTVRTGTTGSTGRTVRTGITGITGNTAREREAREPRLREKYAGKPREAQQREREFWVLQEDLEERELLEGQQRAREGRQSPRAAWEAAQRTNTSSTPTNVCPNCLNPFEQGRGILPDRQLHNGATDKNQAMQRQRLQKGHTVHGSFLPALRAEAVECTRRELHTGNLHQLQPSDSHLVNYRDRVLRPLRPAHSSAPGGDEPTDRPGKGQSPVAPGAAGNQSDAPAANPGRRGVTVPLLRSSGPPGRQRRQRIQRDTGQLATG